MNEELIKSLRRRAEDAEAKLRKLEGCEYPGYTKLKDEYEKFIGELQTDNRNLKSRLTAAEEDGRRMREALNELIEDGECYCMDTYENMGRNPCAWCNAKEAIGAGTEEGR